MGARILWTAAVLLLRMWTAEHAERGKIYIGDRRDQQAAVCRIFAKRIVSERAGASGQRG